MILDIKISIINKNRFSEINKYLKKPILWTFHVIKFMTVRFNTSLCTIYRTHSRTSTTSSEEVTYTFQGRQSPHSPPRGYSSYLPDSQLPELDKTPMRRGKKVHVLLGSYLTF